ncbi:MAG: type II toxin-antitoxin system YafQ family toxin, partial [Gemmatimonadetes bacterium]|nr:type II toxin-antitoxin system YafQ family toxin [Gemmatimonadota bacterium]
MQPSRSGQLKRDYKTCKARGYDMSALQSVMDDLINRKALAPRFRDHTLTGNWRGHRECHIEPDWLLIY